MRYLIPIFFLVSNCFFGQQKTLKFVNDDHSYYDKSRNDFSNYSHIINDIVMKPDSTFEFDSRPYYSCVTWKNYKGKYQIINDTIVFQDNYLVEDDKVRVFYNRTSDDFYLLKFGTDKKSYLNNRSIRIEIQYDFDAKIDDIEKTYIMDSNNEVKILFKDIPNLEKVANIRIEYLLSPTDRRSEYLTENNTINVRDSELPNHIEVEFIEIPKKQVVYRESKFLRKDNKLIFLSTFKTKTMLHDYNRTIEFEKYYTLKKT